MMKWLPSQIKEENITYLDYLFYLDKMLKEAKAKSEAHRKKMSFGGR